MTANYKNQSEKEFVDKCCEYFSKTFSVQREVISQCGKGRIDILLSFNNYYFGIECKIPDKKKGSDIFKYVHQAISYSNMKWPINNQYKHVPILICPALSYNYFILPEETIYISNKEYHKDRHKRFDSHHTFNGFIGGFNIGEVRKNKYGYQFTLSNKVLFSYSNYYGEQKAYVDNKNYFNFLYRFIDNDRAI